MDLFSFTAQLRLRREVVENLVAGVTDEAPTPLSLPPAEGIHAPNAGSSSAVRGWSFAENKISTLRKRRAR